MAPFTGTILADSYGGGWPWGHPSLLCLHDVEAPLAPGYAVSLAQYFARPQSSGGPGTSAHAIAGPDALVKMVPDGNVSWNCGPNGNAITFALEQCGYASFNAAQWVTADGLQQLERVAQWFAWASKLTGIPLKWATDAEIRDAYNTGRRVGCCHHYDITRVLGGTTHWDTGNNYPDARMLTRAKEINGQIVVPKEWDELATKKEVQDAASAGATAAVKAMVPGLETMVNERAASASFWALHALITGTAHGHSFLTKPPFTTEPYLIALVAAMPKHNVTDLEKMVKDLGTPTPPTPPATPT